MKSLKYLALAFATLVVFTSAAFGQNTGTISGTVQDQSGAVVAGAIVKAQNPATNFSRETTSAENGFYRLDCRLVPTRSLLKRLVSRKHSRTMWRLALMTH